MSFLSFCTSWVADEIRKCCWTHGKMLFVLLQVMLVYGMCVQLSKISSLYIRRNKYWGVFIFCNIARNGFYSVLAFPTLRTTNFIVSTFCNIASKKFHRVSISCNLEQWNLIVCLSSVTLRARNSCVYNKFHRPPSCHCVQQILLCVLSTALRARNFIVYPPFAKLRAMKYAIS